MACVGGSGKGNAGSESSQVCAAVCMYLWLGSDRIVIAGSSALTWTWIWIWTWTSGIQLRERTHLASTHTHPHTHPQSAGPDEASGKDRVHAVAL